MENQCVSSTRNAVGTVLNSSRMTVRNVVNSSRNTVSLPQWDIDKEFQIMSYSEKDPNEEFEIMNEEDSNAEVPTRSDYVLDYFHSTQDTNFEKRTHGQTDLLTMPTCAEATKCCPSSPESRKEDSNIQTNNKNTRVSYAQWMYTKLYSIRYHSLQCALQSLSSRTEERKKNVGATPSSPSSVESISTPKSNHSESCVNIMTRRTRERKSLPANHCVLLREKQATVSADPTRKMDESSSSSCEKRLAGGCERVLFSDNQGEINAQSGRKLCTQSYSSTSYNRYANKG